MPLTSPIYEASAYTIGQTQTGHCIHKLTFNEFETMTPSLGSKCANRYTNTGTMVLFVVFSIR